MENATPEMYAHRHKAAFRAAFDFLNAHFPPGDGTEWWDSVAKDASKASADADDERLTIHLIAGVMDYLEDEWRKRRNEDGTEDRQD